MTEYINMTDHDVLLVDDFNNPIQLFKPSGRVTRISTIFKTYDSDGAIPYVNRLEGDPENLPSPEEGKVFIVANIVKQNYIDRKDLAAPVKFVRDNWNKVIGCKALWL